MARLVIAGVGLAFTLFLPTLSALLVAQILAATGWASRLNPLAWVVCAPVLYVTWLLIYLALSAVEIQILLRVFPKKRRIECQPGDVRSGLALIGVFVSYTRLTLLESLPLVKTMQSIDALRDLVFLSYAPRTRLGNPVHLGTALLYDPDITEVGDHAVIGAKSAVVAHSMNISPNGQLIYVCAPVRIGSCATVGGECRLAMGVTIGEDAVIEAGSNVAAFTSVPPGEVWGGSPAVFRRKRTDIHGESQAYSSDVKVRSTAAAHPSEDVPQGLSEDLVTIVRQCVAQSLNLSLENVPSHLRANDCPAWDSLGQVAIAATLSDRLGWRPSPQQLFEMKSIDSIVSMIESNVSIISMIESNVSIVSMIESNDSIPVSSIGAVRPEPFSSDELPLLPVERATTNLARRGENDWPPIRASCRVVIAANFTADPVANSLRLWARAFGIRVDVRFANYNQIEQTLLAPGSLFQENHQGINLVLVSAEDFDLADASTCRARVHQWLACIEQHQTSATGTLIVGTIPPRLDESSEATELASLRLEWHQRLKAIPRVTIVDFSRVVEEIGLSRAGDAEWATVTRSPYSALAYQSLGKAMARILRSQHTPPAKVLALDCDGILWGGVLGEDGPEGIKLSDDGPQRGFVQFQKEIRRLKERGVLLVLLSRNEEKDVWHLFDSHPSMVLQREDIAAWRINWNPKSQGIREVAAELNLGLDSFVFIDDDPANRLQMKTDLPQVFVPEWPESPPLFAPTLRQLWVFDGAHATEEDRRRTEMMHEERDRKQLQLKASNLEQYLEQLGVVVDIREMDEIDIDRVAQLTQKTNQFNLSLKRRTIDEVRDLRKSRARILTIRAHDSFGDYGLVGVAILILNPPGAELDTFLLSCRALGRGVEQAFMHHLTQLASDEGCESLVAPYVEGPRNRPAREFFEKSGLTQTESHLYTWDLRQDFPRPSHVLYRSRNTDSLTLSAP